MGSNDINIGGDFTNLGVFNSGTGTVIFDGTGISNITGSTSFNNLTCTTPNKVIKFKQGDNFIINGTLNINGQNQGTEIVISSQNSIDRFTIKVNSEQEIYYVNVSYCEVDDTGENIIVSNSINGGNNDDTGPDAHLIISGIATYLSISGNSTMTAGTTNELTITAYDSNNRVATGYNGNYGLIFSGLSNSPNGYKPKIEGTEFDNMPIIVNFNRGISGVGLTTLTAYCAETKTLFVSDGEIDSTGYSLDLTVNPAQASSMQYRVDVSDITAGNIMVPSVEIGLYDEYGNLCTNDSTTQISLSKKSGPGSISVSSPKQAINGIVVFNDITGTQAGQYVLTASSVGLSSIDSSSFNILAGELGYFKVEGIISPHIAGTFTTATVTAYDIYDNIKSNYLGEIVFSSSDRGSNTILPTPYTFTEADNGRHTFTNGIRLTTPGIHWVKVRGDGKEGWQVGIEVEPEYELIDIPQLPQPPQPSIGQQPPIETPEQKIDLPEQRPVKLIDSEDKTKTEEGTKEIIKGRGRGDIFYFRYVDKDNEDLRRRYKKYYKKGKYRTVVIVIEGKVVMAPYDEKGVKEEGSKTLTDGDSSQQEGEVK